MTNTKRPAAPRYEVQTRSGTEWSWYCGAASKLAAMDACSAAKRDGYRARVLDTKTGIAYGVTFDTQGTRVLVSVPR